MSFDPFPVNGLLYPHALRARKDIFMKKPNYSCVIFDMDGTLLYTIDDIAKSVNITLKEFGYPEKTIEEVTSFVNNGAYRLMELALPEDKRDKETVTTVLNRYLDIYDEHVCEKTHPYDGISKLVETLRNSGIKLAVVSNKPDRQAKTLAVHCFGEGVFSYVSGSGIGLPTKPDKACTDRAIDALSVDRKDVLYVGDSYVDVLTAKNAALPCAGVLWGCGGDHSFDTEKPDFYIHTAKELESLILG